MLIIRKWCGNHLDSRRLLNFFFLWYFALTRIHVFFVYLLVFGLYSLHMEHVFLMTSGMQFTTSCFLWHMLWCLINHTWVWWLSLASLMACPGLYSHVMLMMLLSFCSCTIPTLPFMDDKDDTLIWFLFLLHNSSFTSLTFPSSLTLWTTYAL